MAIWHERNGEMRPHTKETLFIVGSWVVVWVAGLLVLAAGLALGFGIWVGLDWLADRTLEILQP